MIGLRDLVWFLGCCICEAHMSHFGKAALYDYCRHRLELLRQSKK